MRDVFVGTLCAIGVFMISYRGYERQDDVAGDLACVFAVGVALFPTTLRGDLIPLDIIGKLHLAFAALFFLTLAYFSLCLFTKTDPTKTPTRQKKQRNKVYRACGYTLLASIVLIGLLTFLPLEIQQSLNAYHPVYWLESLGVVAFGISWLTKGEAMLGDNPREHRAAAGGWREVIMLDIGVILGALALKRPIFHSEADLPWRGGGSGQRTHLSL
jgi:hypothetical protein